MPFPSALPIRESIAWLAPVLFSRQRLHIKIEYVKQQLLRAALVESRLAHFESTKIMLLIFIG